MSNEIVDGLEGAINKSGGPKLGNPEYVFVDMATVEILRDAAIKYFALT